jgi:hypothetical protein
MHQQFMVPGRPGHHPLIARLCQRRRLQVFDSLNQALAELGAASEAWVYLGIPARLAVLDRIVQEMLLLREDWGATRHSPEFGRSLVAFDAQPTPWRLGRLAGRC